MAFRVKHSKSNIAGQVATPEQHLLEYQRKRLARLISKHGPTAVNAAVDIVGPSARPGRPRRGRQPEHRVIQSAGLAKPITKPEPRLSEDERKFLSRLIRKHGVATIQAAVHVVGPSASRGRPPRGPLPYYEAMHLADWIDEAADEHRERGSRTPIRDAENELYEMTTGHAREPGDEVIFEAWRLNIKNKRLLGRRDLAAVMEALQKQKSQRAK